jgi:hypothetical protein
VSIRRFFFDFSFAKDENTKIQQQCGLALLFLVKACLAIDLLSTIKKILDDWLLAIETNKAFFAQLLPQACHSCILTHQWSGASWLKAETTIGGIPCLTKFHCSWSIASCTCHNTISRPTNGDKAVTVKSYH